jgi:uncharacterized lipoprotein YmbA
VTQSLRRGLTLAAAAAAAVVLSGCGTFPLPRTYVLGDLDQSAPGGVVNEAGLIHIELRPVAVPDYLDTTDIVRRTASNEVTTSSTGRWGERLSLGITRALALDLARQLPQMVIESRSAYEPSRRLFVDVERFDIGEDGRCTLTARWRVANSGGKDKPDSEQGTFIETSTAKTDAAEASAMTAAIDHLAGQIALTVRASR